MELSVKEDQILKLLKKVKILNYSISLYEKQIKEFNLKIN